MKHLKLFFIFLTTCLTTAAQSPDWKVTNAVISFKIKNAGITVDGTFSGLVADIRFDPAKAYGNKIAASVDAKTISTGISARDNHLKKTEYFDVVKFPKITMQSSSFAKLEDGKFKGFFTLTIKGTTKTVPLIFSFTGSDEKATLTGTFKLNRLDYQVGESSWVLSNDVTVSLLVEVQQ